MAISTGKVLWVQVWGLALVQGAIALTWVIYNLYLVRLLTQFGFPESLATSLIVLENILAAFIEPVMGNFSDRLQHTMGSRFPFIALGMILASACFLGIPAVLVLGGPSGIMRWLLPIMMVLWAIAMTLFRSPALSLLGRYAFRTQLPQAASILTLVGGLAGSLAPLANTVILRMGPLVTFFIGSMSLLGAAFALRAVGPNQTVMAEPPEFLSQESPARFSEQDGYSPNAFHQPGVESAVASQSPENQASVSQSSAPVTRAVSIPKLALVFGAGMGVALGFRLMMQTLPSVISAQISELNPRWVLGTVFLTIAITAIPMGRVVTRAGTRLSMIVGLGLMAGLTALILTGTQAMMIFVMAIAIGTCFSVVSNTTIPFALSMVPNHKAGLGTGMYFSGAAVAMSLYGMAISNGLELSSRSGASIGAVAFLCAAACTLISMKETSQHLKGSQHL
jgi:Na+/melibiose symporter-like transporter